MSLHSQIVNLPCNVPVIPGPNSDMAYRIGHRDARHAAAELANEADAALSRLRDTQRVLVEALRGAEQWLEGWASAEPYLSRIRAALASVEQEQPFHSAQPEGVEVTARDAALRLAKDALVTCVIGGFVDIDGDWCKTHWFDAPFVKAAIAAIDAAMQEPKP